MIGQSMKLKDKVAIVTGAGQGIGRSIALKLAAEGARVVVNDVDVERTGEVVAQIIEAGGQALPCVGSVTDEDFGDRVIATALTTWQDWHIIINNAGYTWDAVIHKMSDEQFDAMLDVHLKAPFRILRAAATPLRSLASADAAAGRRVVRKVVNISSVSGTGGNAAQVNYSAAKAGITGLTKTLAKEWGRYNATVNCVAYGLIHTRLTQAASGPKTQIQIGGREIAVGMPQALIEAVESAIPLGRGGTPEEAAGAAYLFCIPESDYISGQVIICGGGFGSTT